MRLVSTYYLLVNIIMNVVVVVVTNFKSHLAFYANKANSGFIICS